MECSTGREKPPHKNKGGLKTLWNVRQVGKNLHIRKTATLAKCEQSSTLASWSCCRTRMLFDTTPFMSYVSDSSSHFANVELCSHFASVAVFLMWRFFPTCRTFHRVFNPPLCGSFSLCGKYATRTAPKPVFPHRKPAFNKHKHGIRTQRLRVVSYTDFGPNRSMLKIGHS